MFEGDDPNERRGLRVSFTNSRADISQPLFNLVLAILVYDCSCKHCKSRISINNKIRYFSLYIKTSLERNTSIMLSYDNIHMLLGKIRIEKDLSKHQFTYQIIKKISVMITQLFHR